MFFQYSLGVKRDEIRKLEEIAQAEEKKLEQAELYLEEDASMFDEFLKILFSKQQFFSRCLLIYGIYEL